MNEISRREFVISGGAALTLAALPTPRIIGTSREETLNEIRPIRHVSESGANLLLYFVNATRRGGHLAPRDQKSPSYLIAQLPPQSLHEEYFYSGATNVPPTQQLGARLSGPSFLAFRLWPKWNGVDKLPRKWRISYNLPAFFEWHDDDRFALQTANDVSPADWKKLCDFGPAACDFERIKDVAISTSEVGDGPYDLVYYQKLIRGLLDQNSVAQISLFELPAGVLMTLIDPTSDVAARVKGAASNVVFRVNQHLPSTRRRETIRERRFEWRPSGGERVVRRVAERWGAEITVVPRSRALCV